MKIKDIKKILLCLLISFILFLTSCSNNKNSISKQNIAESSTETQKEEYNIDIRL